MVFLSHPCLLGLWACYDIELMALSCYCSFEMFSFSLLDSVNWWILSTIKAHFRLRLNFSWYMKVSMATKIKKFTVGKQDNHFFFELFLNITTSVMNKSLSNPSYQSFLLFFDSTVPSEHTWAFCHWHLYWRHWIPPQVT